MKKLLARMLAAALILGMLTVNACAITPVVSYPNLADSPFVPDYPLVPPVPVMPDSPCAPDFSPKPAPASAIESPFVPELSE